GMFRADRDDACGIRRDPQPPVSIPGASRPRGGRSGARATRRGTTFELPGGRAVRWKWWHLRRFRAADEGSGTGMSAHEFGPARQPGSPLARFRCSDCGYGVSRQMAPVRCPMCSGTAWNFETWRPFTHQLADADLPLTRDPHVDSFFPGVP